MTNIPGNQPPQFDPSQPYTPPPSQPYTPGVYPPPKKGSSALKIILIIVAIFVGIGMIGAGIVGYVVYKVAKTSHLTASSQPATEADLGVPIYPGAEQGKATVRMTIAGKDMLTANFVTSDAKDQVVAFYQDKLGSDARENASGNGESFVLNKGEGESVALTVSQQPSFEGGKTQIVIVHLTKAATPSN